MISKLVLATRNSDKVREIKRIIDTLEIEILCLNDFPEIPEIIEDGDTFQDNAYKKARTVFTHTGIPALADDSGLEVDYLNGEPGVYSSRFAGERATYSQNNQKLLHLLQDVPPEKRQARFRCVMALKTATEVKFVEGVCEGTIMAELRGSGGFGYDPLFYAAEYKKTFAELELKVKNQISHRGKALRQIQQELKKL